MNSVLKAIKKRRSVRSYNQKPISKDIIKTIIEAGNDAPSAMNSQPWRFVVVKNKDIKRKLLETALPGAKRFFESLKNSFPERYELIMNRFKEMKDPIYYSAPVILFVIGSGRHADLSCPLACQNIMLAAYSLGIGSCWIGSGSMITDNAEIVNALELKEGEKIFGPIVLGYPKVYPEPPAKRKPKVKWI